MAAAFHLTVCLTAMAIQVSLCAGQLRNYSGKEKENEVMARDKNDTWMARGFT